MKEINLLLEDSEIFLLRTQVRLMQILNPNPEDESIGLCPENIE